MALVSATAFLGVQQGCGSDGTGGSKKAGSRNTGGSEQPGGSGGEGGQGDTSNGGGGQSAGTQNAGSSGENGNAGSDKGSAGDNGGSGGSNGGGSTGTGGGSTNLAGSITLTGGLYSQASFSGYTYTAKDSMSSIEPPCGKDDNGDPAPCFEEAACVKGEVAQIPKLGDGGLDYDGVWGVLFGWNLTVQGDADPDNPPTSIEGKTTITIGLTGAQLPPSGNVRIQMDVPQDDGKLKTYCAKASLKEGAATVNIADFKTMCWGATGEDWTDGLKPKNVAIQLVASNSKSIPFDFCVGELKFE